jgi:predicted nuclease of restriction endonuclease-like RecB superfamily
MNVSRFTEISYQKSFVPEKTTENRCNDGEADVLADFLLKDVLGGEMVPLEVFGMNTPDYLARKAVKLAHYHEEYGEGNW